MAQHVVTAVGPPTAPPPSIGAHYIDSVTGDIYLGNGTVSVDDWVLGGGGGGITGYELWTLFVSTDNIAEWFAMSRDSGESWASDEDQLRDGWKVLAGGELEFPRITKGCVLGHIGQAVCIDGSAFKA